ncbi:MAG: hypothetical protein GC179_19355 [Anaerolineaceae bacterium]|nr:hypothetical protein [Anaerolineaceae bacterium]
MSEEKREPLVLVQQYQELVLAYEALDKEIDSLIMAHGGNSEKMPPEDFDRYRHLARKRDDIKGEMHELEMELNIDE